MIANMFLPAVFVAALTLTLAFVPVVVVETLVVRAFLRRPWGDLGLVVLMANAASTAVGLLASFLIEVGLIGLQSLITQRDAWGDLGTGVVVLYIVVCFVVSVSLEALFLRDRAPREEPGEPPPLARRPATLGRVFAAAATANAVSYAGILVWLFVATNV